MGMMQVAALSRNQGSALTAIASPSSVQGSSGTATVTSSPTTVTPSGSPGPYTYSWVKVSGGAITANSPSSATTTFSGQPLIGGFLNATFRCTVTGSSQSTQSNGVSVSLERI